MRIIVVGDIHGYEMWKSIVRQEPNFDKFVFIGDYFDNYGYNSSAEQIYNFKEILRFIDANPGKVELLVGNHDYQYLRGVTDKYFGSYQSVTAADIQEVLHEAIDKGYLKMAYRHSNIMFTHAGITSTFVKDIKWDKITPIENVLNDLFLFKPRTFEFYEHDYSDEGNNVHQSPIWVRPESLLKNAFQYETLKQVVGHTRYPRLTVTANRYYFIDVLDKGEYLEIEDSLFTIKQIQTND